MTCPADKDSVAPGRIDELAAVSPELSARVRVRCVACRSDLDAASSCYCARCLAAYHVVCFDGTCVVLGCLENRVVRPRSPARWRAAVEVVLLGVLLVGIGALLGAHPWVLPPDAESPTLKSRD